MFHTIRNNETNESESRRKTNPSLRRVSAIATILLTLFPFILSTGCADGNQGFNLFGPRGEEWTILVARTQGPDRNSRAAGIERELKSCPELNPNAVSVHQDGRTCMITYGSYFRQIEDDSRRRSVPPKMQEDLKLIQLGIPRLRGRYAGASIMPKPFKDMGNPAWLVDNGSGTWTLLIATFENTAGYYTRHADAYALCRELRRKGYQAYYHHGKLVSEVTVGSFGPQAMMQDEYQSGNTSRDRYADYSRHSTISYSPEVRQLQKKEHFAFLLNNGRKQAYRGHIGARQYRASKLVRFRFEDEMNDYGFEENLW